MKPWQRRQLKKNVDWYINFVLKQGYAKTEDEAYSLLKYKWKNATRTFNSDGSITISYDNFFISESP